MGSTADDAARAAAERHDRHAARMGAYAKAVERAGPMPMIQSDSRKRSYQDGLEAGRILGATIPQLCEGEGPVYVMGFCHAIEYWLDRCREAADKGGDS